MRWLLFLLISSAWPQEAPPECKDIQQIVEMQRNTALTWHSISEAKLIEMRVELERFSTTVQVRPSAALQTSSAMEPISRLRA